MIQLVAKKKILMPHAMVSTQSILTYIQNMKYIYMSMIFTFLDLRQNFWHRSSTYPSRLFLSYVSDAMVVIGRGQTEEGYLSYVVMDTNAFRYWIWKYKRLLW
jgi:hypothetical protein